MSRTFSVCFAVLLFAVLLFAAYEDFTTYTENDPGSDITITANKADVDDMDRTVRAWVNKDYGADYFGQGDFEIRAEVTHSNSTNWGVMICFGVMSADTDWYGHAQNSGDVLGFTIVRTPTPWAGINWYSSVMESGSITSDMYFESLTSSKRYVTITLDRDGGGSGFGQVNMVIRSGSHEGSILDTLTVDLTEEGATYRYLFVASSNYSAGGSSYRMWADIENLEIISVESGGAGQPQMMTLGIG